MDSKTLAVSISCLAAAALAAFDVKPIVFPADSPATVTVRAENDAERKILAETPLYYISSQGHWSDGKLHGKSRWRPVWEKIEAKRGDGELTFTVRLNGEGWHSLWFGVPDAKWNFPAKTTRSFMLYSLKPDLFELRPWKGDIHQHSVRCGHAKQEPKVIPAYNRRAGYDFMALSEHRQQAPSVEAIEAAEPWQCGLVLFTGEEFHTERNILHSVAVGHTSGINAWQQAHPEEFKRRVDEELKNQIYDQYGLEPYLRRNAAMAAVLYRVGRELGAKVLVYSHPTDLIYGKQVEVRWTDKDQYGRILGVVYLSSASGMVDVNLTMVKNGCAWHYSYHDNTPAYAAAEKEARQNRRGLWAAESPINPYQWRKSRRNM